MSNRVYSPDAQPPALSLGSVYPPDSFSKSQAKAELQGISTRLGSYIQYVREISENANQVDLGAFVNSIRILEDELVGMKALYERELGNSRQESEDISRNKNQLQQEVNKLRQHVVELETRLGTETEKNRQAVAEIDSLQRTVMTRDREVTEAKLAIQRPITDLDDLSKEFNAVLREKEDIKRRYESEQLQRQEIADQHHQLSKKLDIDTQVHSQESQDLTDRLNAASNTILTLESKIREMTHADTALSEMLQRVRAVAEDEIRRYQMDSEARFSQNVSELQSQLNECNRKIADLNERNQQLHTELGEYQSANRGLQGQVTSLEHQRRVLEDELCADRQRSHDHIKLLEAKLVQLQDNVINKMKELNAARDAQIPLKAEIETLRTMLEEEENRLKMPPTPRMDTSKPLPPPNVLSANFGNSASTTDAAPISSYSRGGVSQGRVFTQVSGGQRDESPRPLGPVRVRSAPVTKQHYVPTSLGQGKDYFDELFNDLRVREMREEQGLTNIIPAPPADNKDAERRGSGDQGSRVNSGVRSQEGSRASVAARSMDFTTYSASAVGDLRITEVDKEGFYIRLLNGAITKEADLGGYMIQQNVGGHPVSVYRFPPRTRVPASDTVTVWAACADTAKHCPPTDFYFREQEKWGTGPECTTIVCKPNGQAVAWTTNSHRVTPDAYTQSNDNTAQQPATTTGTEALNEYTDCDKDADLPVYNMNVNAPPPEPVYLRREKAPAATLAAQKHPHGGPPSAPSHPGTGQARCLTLGNDNSSVNRQTRGHSIRPDPIPGAPYAGASAQRMGSASLRRYNSAAGTVRGSGAIANKSAGTIRYGPRSPFLSPLQQDYTLRQNTGATVLA